MVGKVWKYGDNVDTDLILPAKYLNISDPEELAKHCMESADPNFVKNVGKGDIIVGGDNFGCGSSREHAPMSIKAIGISCVIAKSFARIFYRNAFNIGLPILECAETDSFQTGDHLEVDLKKGEIKHIETNKTFSTNPIPPFMQELIMAGGLMNYVMKQKVNL